MTKRSTRSFSEKFNRNLQLKRAKRGMRKPLDVSHLMNRSMPRMRFPADGLLASDPKEMQQLLDERDQLMEQLRKVIYLCAVYGTWITKLQIPEEMTELREEQAALKKHLAQTHNILKHNLDLLEQTDDMTKAQQLARLIEIGPEIMAIMSEMPETNAKISKFMTENQEQLNQTFMDDPLVAQLVQPLTDIAMIAENPQEETSPDTEIRGETTAAVYHDDAAGFTQPTE